MPEPGGGEIIQNPEISSEPLTQDVSLENNISQKTNSLISEAYWQALKKETKRIPELFGETLKKGREMSRIFEFVTRPEIVTFLGINILERFRQTTLLQQPHFQDLNNPSHVAPAAPESALPFLRNSGDLWDGYTYSMLTYYGITMLNKNTPEVVKVGLSTLVGLGVVIGAESGILHSGFVRNSPDFGDIPAGVVGALAFAGVKMLNKDFIGKCTESIKKIRDEIRNSPAEKANAEFLRDFDEDEGYYEDFAYASNLETSSTEETPS